MKEWSLRKASTISRETSHTTQQQASSPASTRKAQDSLRKGRTIPSVLQHLREGTDR